MLIGSNLSVPISVYQARSECSLLSERSDALDLLQEPKTPSILCLVFKGDHGCLINSRMSLLFNLSLPKSLFH